MNTSGLFTVHEVIVKAKVGDKFTFIPFGDVHRDAPSFAHEEWKEFLTFAKRAKNPLYLGMGDYSDGCSTSERTIIGNPALHESTRSTLDNVYKGVTKTLSNELGFMRGKLMGMIGGNHFFAFQDGNTSDHLLCSQLGAKFLGVCSLIRLSFRISGSTNKCASIDIMAHHGKGGGSLAGSSFNTVSKMQDVMEADIYLMGHDHSRGCIPARPRLRLTQGKGVLSVKERTPILGRTGSFLKAYEPGMPNYNVDVCRSPSSLGWISFELEVCRDQSDGRDEMKIKIRGTS